MDIFPPVFDDLSHNAYSYLLRCNRPNRKSYRSYYPVNVSLSETLFLKSLEEKGFFPLAPEETNIPCLCPQCYLQCIKVMIMTACCNNNICILINRNF